MEYPKDKPIRLHGAALKALNDAIFERDKHCCIVCGDWVAEGIKFHHEPCGINKSDEINKGVVLCCKCHHERHFTDNGPAIREQVTTYLTEHILNCK